MPPATQAAALSGYRVIEWCGARWSAAAGYAGKMLADLGAEVLKVEPPQGDPVRWLDAFGGAPFQGERLEFTYLNRGKRSLCLDLAEPGQVEALAGLARTADAVLDAAPDDAAPVRGRLREVVAQRPGVWCAIRPFGESGPRAGWRGSDLIALASGGVLYVTGEPGTPPVRAGLDLSYRIGGQSAAAAVLLALYAQLDEAVFRPIDISLQEAVATFTTMVGVSKYEEDGLITARRGLRYSAVPPGWCYRARDGYVAINAGRPQMWDTLAAWVAEVTGNTAVRDELFRGPSSNRVEDADLLISLVEEMTTRFTMAELYEEGQRRHLAVSPLSTPGDIARNPQLAARGFFVADGQGRRMAGPPYRLAATPAAARGDAPELGEYNRALGLEVPRG